MNISYLLYEAERPRSATEQREADALAGQLAAEAAKTGRMVKAVVSRYAGVARRREPVIPGDDLIPVAGSRR